MHKVVAVVAIIHALDTSTFLAGYLQRIRLAHSKTVSRSERMREPLAEPPDDAFLAKDGPPPLVVGGTERNSIACLRFVVRFNNDTA